jgi:outer membrane immunogenic protein
MRSFVLGYAALAALLGIGSAQAADLGPKPEPVYKAPAMVPPAFSWTGCYIGANVGGAWGKSNVDIPLYPSNVDITDTSVIGGGQVGCNYQFAGGFVVGVEGDFDWTD